MANIFHVHYSKVLLTIISDHFQQGNHKHLMSSSSWRVCYDDNVPWCSELNAGFYMSMHFFSFHHTAICFPRNLAGRCYCHLHTLKLPHIIQPSDHSYKTVQNRQVWFCDAPSKPAGDSMKGTSKELVFLQLELSEGAPDEFVQCKSKSKKSVSCDDFAAMALCVFYV